MSRRQKAVVLAVGVLIVVAFVAAVLNPGAGDSGPVGWLGRWVGDAAGAPPEDLAPDCQEPDGRLVFGGSCTIEVASSDEDLRLVTLTAGSPVSVTAPAPAGGYTVRTDVAAGELVRVAVGSDGAEIDLDCEDDDDCVVTIGAGDDG
jgi:hypothetical protein